MPSSSQQPPVTRAATPDEAVIMQSIAEGDVAALGILFDRSARQVYSLVMQLVRTHDEAEDIVESTFWQAWEESGSLIGSSDVRAWLLSTGRQKALDRLRSRKRSREELLLDKRQPGDLVTAYVSDSARDEKDLAAVRAFSELEPGERQILELGYFRGLSQTEIAELTGESAATVRRRMRAALENLRTPEPIENSPQ